MTTVKRYFDSIAHKPKYFLGDRVYGKWNGIPYVGTVGIESLLSLDEGPYVIVLLDLPIVRGDKIHNIVRVSPKDVRRLK